MNIYISADFHFNHKMLVDKGYRPYNYYALIWKELFNLPKDSLLINLGDICIGNDLEIHNKLALKSNIKKILVKGNHDNKSTHWYLNHGWDFVCEQFQDTYFGKKIVFSHVPVKDHGFDLNIHGHFHITTREDYIKEYNEILSNKHILISLEELNYKPVLLETVLKQRI